MLFTALRQLVPLGRGGRLTTESSVADVATAVRIPHRRERGGPGDDRHGPLGLERPGRRGDRLQIRQVLVVNPQIGDDPQPTTHVGNRHCSAAK